MGLFDLFKKQTKEAPHKKEEHHGMPSTLAAYSNMRVEVTDFDGRLLFVAKLMNPRGYKAELHQFFEASIPQDTESLHVRIRGYHDRDKKAVYMEGNIAPAEAERIWHVDDLTLVKVWNERSFFRLDTDIAATATALGAGAKGHPCQLLNISVGGARVGSGHRYWEGDKFLLTVQLMEDVETSVMVCQVLRVVEKEDGTYEYGCRFMELSEADQDKITKSIFDAQLKSKRRYR